MGMKTGENRGKEREGIKKQASAVADEPLRCAASRQTCCKQRWTLSVINLQPNYTVSINVPPLTCYNLDLHDPITTIFRQKCYSEK